MYYIIILAPFGILWHQYRLFLILRRYTYKNKTCPQTDGELCFFGSLGPQKPRYSSRQSLTSSFMGKQALLKWQEWDNSLYLA